MTDATPATFALDAVAGADRPVDALIGALAAAEEAAQDHLDNEQDDDEVGAAEPPIFQPVVDESGMAIAAIRLDREPGTREFKITLLTAVPLLPADQQGVS